MIKDILMLVSKLSESEDGEIEINWPSDTFFSSWIIKYNSNKVRIETTWYQVLGKLEDLLNANNILEIERQEFIDKWMTLLSFIKTKLEQSGYNSTNLEDFHELENLVR